jgi:hypothetical protein
MIPQVDRMRQQETQKNISKKQEKSTEKFKDFA